MSQTAEKMEPQQEIFPQPDNIIKDALINESTYQEMYDRSINDPEGFWSDMAKRIDWFKSPTVIKDTSFSPNNVHIKWFEDGVLNASYNCIDRHLPHKAKDTALIWESDNPELEKNITFQTLSDEVCKLANALKERGVKKGDRVTIYMPMVPEAVYSMLACARIGAVHSVVFGGFSPESLKDRILNCESTVVITADEGVRGGKTIPLKKNVDTALASCPDVNTVVVLKHTGNDINWHDDRDIWWHENVENQSTECPCEEMNAEDPLFILYTSGSTGKPKGVLHTTGGYMVYTNLTFETVFDYKEGEVYWCTADVGWVTGHSYIVYGPLSNGATTLIFEGVPNYPAVSRFWNVVDKHNVNIFYTAPTAIRALLQQGEEHVKATSRKSLRVLGTVGEPINHEAWLWYYEVVGEGRCPIVDTWWQTETGGMLITPLVGAMPLKPGSATKPFFGVKPTIVDTDGNELHGPCEGALCISDSWPGQMRTVFKDHDRFEQTYFSTFNNMYFTGDGCKRDDDGYYWITGRMDDVLNVSGHRLGTAEIESAINEHDKIAESAVVGFPHDIKGQGIYAYVTLNAGETANDELKTEIVQLVRKIIGPIATIDVIQFANALPKTRSGKIMRRILRKIAANEFDSLGDTSTLADPAVVDHLIEDRKK
jgi:acetyl-CoA synthetase